VHGSNTVVPAHYHAAIGAVTVAFMTFTWPLLARLGVSMGEGRLARAMALQPLAFGAGQAVFAFGFALAGAHGMGRKLYAGEQQVRTLAETLGLGVMGVGGFIAIAAGLLFVGVVLRAWLRALLRGETWNVNIPSNG
jgi:heme/copper-type cytochrome/quinol oxidase subunit 1